MVYSTNKPVKVARTGEKRKPRQASQNDETLQNIMRKEYARGRYEARTDWEMIREIDCIKQDGQTEKWMYYLALPLRLRQRD